MALDTGTVTLISLAISTVGGIVLAWIGLQTAALNRKVDEVKVNTDGILEATTKAKDRAEGKSEAAVEIATAAIKPPAPAASGLPSRSQTEAGSPAPPAPGKT